MDNVKQTKIVWHCKACGHIQDVDTGNNFCEVCGCDFLISGEPIEVEVDVSVKLKEKLKYKQHQAEDAVRKADAKARAEREQAEKARQEKERLKKERLEKERLEKERLEKERLEKERLEEERLEEERQKQEQAGQERRENSAEDAGNTGHTDRQDGGSVKKSGNSARWKIAAVAAAALVLLVAAGLLLSRFWQRADPNGPDDGGSGQAGTVDPVGSGGSDPTAGSPGSAALVAHVFTEYDLRNALASNRYTGIEIQAGFDITASIDLTKPVLVRSGIQMMIMPQATVRVYDQLTLSMDSCLNNTGLLLIGANGHLKVAGEYSDVGLLRTLSGGTVHVADTGWMSINALWLASADDLTGSNFSLNQTLYVVADVSKDFENAVHVRSMEELDQAAGDRRVSAIVVDDSFDLEHFCSVNKPLLIAANAVLGSRSEDSCGLDLSAPCVNLGQFTGSLLLSDGSTYINQGITDVDIQSDGTAAIFNFSELNLRHGQYRHSGIMNFGKLLHDGRSDDSSMAPLDFIGCEMYNFRAFTIASGSDFTADDGCHIDSRGSFVVERDANFRNLSTLMTSDLTVQGNVDNYAGNIETSPECLHIEDGARISGGTLWTGGGWVDAAGLDNVLILPYKDNKGEPHFYTIDWDGFLQGDTSARGVRVTDQREFDGDLTTDFDIYVESGASLTVHGTLNLRNLLVASGAEVRADGLIIRDEYLQVHGDGSVILSGGDLEFRNADGALFGMVDLDGGQLKLTNATLLSRADLRGCGGIELAGNGCFFACSGGLTLTDTASLRLSNGSAIWMNTYLDCGGDVHISEGARLCMVSGARFYNGASIENRGLFESFCSDLQIDGGNRFSNSGNVRIEGFECHNLNLDGPFSNDGYMSVSGRLHINGDFVNQGDMNITWGFLEVGGSMDNRGTVFSDGSGGGFSGNWNGGGVEYR